MNTAKEIKIRDFIIIEKLNVIIMSFAYIGLFFSGFIFQNPSYNQIAGIMGWIIWIIGLLLAFSPNIVFKRRGGVEKGKSYVHTTRLVNDGIYGVIRHPQYTGGMVIAFSICLILQTPVACILASISMVTAYFSMVFEEKTLMTKFGTEYQNYKRDVPRANFIIGLMRNLRKINR